MNVEPYEEKQVVEIANPTGRKIKQLKQGVSFDKKTGKFYRNKTLEDVTVDATNIPNIALPEYVMRHVSMY